MKAELNMLIKRISHDLSTEYTQLIGKKSYTTTITWIPIFIRNNIIYAQFHETWISRK